MESGEHEMSEVEVIEVSVVEYQRLINRSKKLRALEVGGVDTWEHYEESLTDYFIKED